jgi:hypothetical protein
MPHTKKANFFLFDKASADVEQVIKMMKNGDMTIKGDFGRWE